MIREVMKRRFTVPATAAALAVIVAGCGSSSSSTTATAPQGTTATQSAPSTPSQAATTTGSNSENNRQGSSEETSSSPMTPENSIKTYGWPAASALKGALAATAFSFLKAIAHSDYPKLCAGLSASNRKELETFDKGNHKVDGCPAILKTLIAGRGVSEARKAAAGKLISVRVKGDTSFVLFSPKGGKPSYFVLRREGSAWKAISLAPGTPLQVP